MRIDGIEIVGEIPEDEARAYIRRAPEGTYKIEAWPHGEEIDLTYYTLKRTPFERIRRITGYLVGTMDRWNDAKKAEERDRVKHAVI